MKSLRERAIQLKFRLPLITEDISIGLDKDNHVETVFLLTKTSDSEG